MDPTTPCKRRSRVPCGLLGMIALVVAIEAIVAGFHGIRGHGIGYEWWLTFQRAALGSQRYEILCFGDSQMKLDVQPRILQPILDRTVYDLAVIGGQAPSSYYLLRRALDAGARPKVVLVDYYQTLLMGFQERNREWWPLVLSPRNALEMTWNSGTPDTLADWLLYHALPTLRYRNAIRNALGIGGIVLNPYEEANMLARNTAINLGALASDEAPTYKDDPTKLHPTLAPLPFNCTKFNAEYIQKFLDLAAEHNIRVFYLICPCSPNWQRGSREKDPRGKYERAIRGHVLKYKNVQVIDGRSAGYERALFRDHSHLSHRGATAFSTDLAYVLKRELGPDATRTRWINLRRLDVAPPAVKLEISCDSGRIAQQRSAQRR